MKEVINTIRSYYENGYDIQKAIHIGTYIVVGTRAGTLCDGAHPRTPGFVGNCLVFDSRFVLSPLQQPIR